MKIEDRVLKTIGNLTVRKWKCEYDLKKVEDMEELGLEEIAEIKKQGRSDLEYIGWGLEILKEIVTGD